MEEKKDGTFVVFTVRVKHEARDLYAPGAAPEFVSMDNVTVPAKGRSYIDIGLEGGDVALDSGEPVELYHFTMGRSPLPPLAIEPAHTGPHRGGHSCNLPVVVCNPTDQPIILPRGSKLAYPLEAGMRPILMRFTYPPILDEKNVEFYACASPTPRVRLNISSVIGSDGKSGPVAGYGTYKSPAKIVVVNAEAIHLTDNRAVFDTGFKVVCIDAGTRAEIGYYVTGGSAPGLTMDGGRRAVQVGERSNLIVVLKQQGATTIPAGTEIAEIKTAYPGCVSIKLVDAQNKIFNVPPPEKSLSFTASDVIFYVAAGPRVRLATGRSDVVGYNPETIIVTAIEGFRYEPGHVYDTGAYIKCMAGSISLQFDIVTAVGSSESAHVGVLDDVQTVKADNRGTIGIKMGRRDAHKSAGHPFPAGAPIAHIKTAAKGTVKMLTVDRNHPVFTLGVPGAPGGA